MQSSIIEFNDADNFVQIMHGKTFKFAVVLISRGGRTMDWLERMNRAMDYIKRIWLTISHTTT